jgi:N-acetylglucosaminyl-diphospho-decaprenol L-rhamnosyltransferase
VSESHVPSKPMACIAIVSWNTRPYLRQCLDSLRPVIEVAGHEAWVVDNGSSDGSPEMVERSYRWVRLIRAPSNLGFGGAVNEAASRSSAEWLVAANADIELCPGALQALMAVGTATPRAGAIAPRLLLPDCSIQQSAFSFPSLTATILSNAGIHRLRRQWARRIQLESRWDPTVQQEVDYAMGAFLLIRRSAFDAVGGFDAGQWMFAEDMDLCWRLREAGWSTVFTPAATVLHVGGASTETAFGRDDTNALKLAALYAWLGRNRGRTTMTAFAAINFAGAIARYVSASLLRMLAPRRGKARAIDARTWFDITRRAWPMMRTARTDTSSYAR